MSKKTFLQVLFLMLTFFAFVFIYAERYERHQMWFYRGRVYFIDRTKETAHYLQPEESYEKTLKDLGAEPVK
jgi:hypothetical protein